MKTDTKEFTRKLKLINHFHDYKDQDDSLVRNKSNFNPRTYNEDLNQIVTSLENENPTTTLIPDNLTPAERN